MEFIYMLVFDDMSWEDITIILLKEDAIRISKENIHGRVEIFEKSPNGYRPTYNYYLNGAYIHTKKLKI